LREGAIADNVIFGRLLLLQEKLVSMLLLGSPGKALQKKRSYGSGYTSEYG
jgi:hypothetical protein